MKDKITIALFLYAGVMFAAKAGRADEWWDLIYIPVGFAFVYCGVECLLRAIEKRTAALAPSTGAASSG